MKQPQLIPLVGSSQTARSFEVGFFIDAFRSSVRSNHSPNPKRRCCSKHQLTRAGTMIRAPQRVQKTADALYSLAPHLEQVMRNFPRKLGLETLPRLEKPNAR